jgi:hypothetical protein
MATLTPMTGPVFVPQPNVGTIRYGLFAAANGPLPMPDHGDIGGVQYLEEHCGNAHLWAAASCTGATVNGGVLPIDACDGTAIGLPFQAVASIKLGAFPWDSPEVERRARVRLGDNSQYVAEQAFWGGTADVQPVLQRPELNGGSTGILDVTPTPGTPVTIEYGVGLLEDALAQYSYPGIIHARPLVAPYTIERQLSPMPTRGSKGATDLQYTPMGNIWSFGRGYTGHKPTDDTVAPAAGTAYLVATGAVTVVRDDHVYVNPPERTFDRAGNAWQTTAQQAFAITVDCVAFFVLVSLNAMTGSTAAATATPVNY